jgi:hypothetical protein
MLADKQTRSMAIMATRHCLIGCGIGEVLGMVIGTAFDLSNSITILLAVFLAFVFGYSFTFFPLLKSMSRKRAANTALAADTVSITSMELIDNAVIIFIPGALHATLSQFLFWFSLGSSLVVAFIVTVPVNYWLISRGKGHAVVHSGHDHMHHH